MLYQVHPAKLKKFITGDAGESEVVENGEKEPKQAVLSKDTKEKGDTITIPLDLTIVYSTLSPMSVAEKKMARDRSVFFTTGTTAKR